MSLLIRGARVVTLAGDRPRRGRALGELAALPRGDVLIEGGRIVAVAPQIALVRPADRTVDAGGRVLVPAFVDCHTHALWAGDRLAEWEMKLRGASYLDILSAGGGIMSTVRAVRTTPEAQLQDLLHERLAKFLDGGTASVEIKSGYGLDTETELKMLRVIRAAADVAPVSVVPTALLGHAIDPGVPGFVERTIRETLPAVHAEFPSAAVDAYCESGAWSVPDTVRLLERARELGHPVRVHADQFNSLGMVPEAVRLGAVSVDHLEASSAADLDLLAGSGTFGVVLPICGLHLDGRYAAMRRFVDSGGLLAVATNCNPGSAPSTSMPLAIALAVRRCGLTPAEAIAACTVNAAEVLGLHDRGQIAAGQRADAVLLAHTDERSLAYELGSSPPSMVIAGGRVVRG